MEIRWVGSIPKRGIFLPDADRSGPPKSSGPPRPTSTPSRLRPRGCRQRPRGRARGRGGGRSHRRDRARRHEGGRAEPPALGSGGRSAPAWRAGGRTWRRSRTQPLQSALQDHGPLLRRPIPRPTVLPCRRPFYLSSRALGDRAPVFGDQVRIMTRTIRSIFDHYSMIVRMQNSGSR